LAALRARFDGIAHSITGDWHWDGRADVQAFDLRAFGVNDVLGVFSGQLQGRAGRTGLSARGKVLVPGLHTAPLSLDVAQRIPHDRVASDEDWAIRPQFVESPPEWAGGRVACTIPTLSAPDSDGTS
jgi:hypothetical protein